VTTGRFNLSIEEEAALREVAAKWPHDKQLRAEFNNDRAVCEAFFKARARGNARTFGRGTQTVESEETRPAPVSEAPARSPAASTAAGAGDEWDRDDELRREFDNNREAYEAYARAMKSGRVKILGRARSAPGAASRPQGPSPAARLPAAPAARATDDGAPLAGRVMQGRMEFATFNDFYAWRAPFAKRQIEAGELTEGELRANLVGRWNEMVRAQAPTLSSAR